ncbi:uncharacterized protein LW93_472 [Fusarium fujikuroi]|nr:uncharacterized protein LW93_472 [Fusarium fujikuroi]
MDESHLTPVQTLSCTNDQLDYLFHHLILPSKLPGHDDALASNEEFLINFVIQFLTRFGELSDEADDLVTNRYIVMLNNTRDARDSNVYLDSRSVQNSFKRLSDQVNAASMYHITEQNAGLIIRRLESSYSFETFELSPTNRAAVATKGRLIREFPATAIEVSAKDFNDSSFQEVLAKTLVKMSHQAVAEMQPKVKKAQQMHNEERDTTDPRIVTELLTSFLRGAGTPTEIKAVQKRTREEVSWNNSRDAWTRSPLWLLLRVGLQLTMVRHPRGSQELYKRFMVFMIAQALQLACEKSSSSEVIHLMMAKISRRLCKLGDIEDGPWLHVIKDIVSSASRYLKERWINIQQRNEQPLDLGVLAEFKFEEHTDFSLPELDTFLATIPRRQNLSATKEFKAKPIALALGPLTLPGVNGSVNNDNISFELAAVEAWVENNLSTWLQHHLNSDQSCHGLNTLLEHYHMSAERWYTGRPERMSKMLLTLGEIWVAIDKMAVHHNPLMLKYRNEIPREVFSDLLVHSKKDMERLHRLEEYLDDSSGKLKLSALLSYGQRLSFAVEYFRQSPKLQEKKEQIERSAQSYRDKKLQQFRKLKAKYDDIMKKYDDMQCEKVFQVEHDVEYYVHTKNKCARCALPAQAKKLKFSPHEWPLPADELEAQTSVFEMDVSVSFAVWRDATIYFLDNILKFESSSAGDYPRASFPLTTYKPLSSWCKSLRHRVQLLSEIKPHSQTHRNQKSIETFTEADVCLNNGLRFQYHDSSRNTFLSTFKPTTEISKRCTIELPKRAHALQRFMARTWLCENGETPNQAIASQSECPEYMSLGEFKALAVLPYGYRLQWMKILTQLAMPTVDFNKPETALFLLQIMLQAGPFDEDEPTRHAHTRPTEVEFGSQILNYLSESVSRVQENWESYTSLCSFTCLATRLLALADKSLSTKVLDLIAKCREISYKPVTNLLSKVQDIDHRTQREEFLEAAVHIALVCIETFNLEGDHFEQGDALYGIMLDRYKITMHRSLPILVNEITAKGISCLHVAIKWRWPDFAREGEWSLISDHWLTEITGNLQVHVSLLTGQLLVNGLPVSRLPQKYETHREYQKLFGLATMEVMPSNLPGMSFCATKMFHSYTVHLGMQTKKGIDDLLVRVSKNGLTFHLIPSRNLQDLFPNSFTNNHVHRLEEAFGEIEFCHVSDPWPSMKRESWHLRKNSDTWKLSLGKESVLVSPWSELGKRIFHIFSPLQPASDLHLVLHQRSKELEVQLPKLRLEFMIKSKTSNIKSRQFRDMEVDQNQAIGTLIGLENKLVLRNSPDSQIRSVIIPEGNVSCQMSTGYGVENHVEVTLDREAASRVQTYRLDLLLRRVVPNDKVESKLYLAYLHTLTSYCLPDPFLQRTGAEEALAILGSASVRAPTAFSESTYGKEVRNILKKYREVQFLFPKNPVPVIDQHRSKDELVDRAILRTSGTRVSGFGAEDFTTKQDVRYASREKSKSLERSTRTVEMAYRVYNKSCALSRPVSGRLGHLLFSLMSGDERVHTKEILPKSRIDYDSSWLQGPESYLSSVWFQLHNSYKKSVTWFDKYELMMWMATMSYSSEYDPQVGQALLLLTQFRSMADFKLLGTSSYNLTAGCQIRDEDLRAAVAPYVVSYASSPDAISARRFDERSSEVGNWRRDEYRKRSAKAIDTFVKHLQRQWPSEDPKKPSDPYMELTSYIRMGPAMESALGKWNQWLKNLRLRKHLDIVAGYMREDSSHVDLIRELENGGHQSWCPFDHPEWLLLECEMMQLNMGEGKSTVIVPIVATALGDRTKLVRVIVARPQAKQMHQMLISKLSGLLDRPVYMLPFSRDTKMDLQTANTIQCLMKRCTQEGGILMVQPEHLLSFQLMELEFRIRGDIQVAEAMSQTRKLFDRSSRDIVDKSDENFSVKFELIYTLGKQRPIEHSPDRWVIIQEVMGLIAKFGPEIKSKYPYSIEFDARHVGRYPRLRILRPNAEAEIFNRVTEMICETGMAGFPIARQPKRIRDAVQRYISQAEPTASDIEAVEKSSLRSETVSRNILLLRGLFAGGILSFALGGKRWRVNYGVDHNREKITKLAVPFRAKDNPTPRSEFSQPDVVITLTCLSYCYSGLDDDALFAAFELLSRSDSATQEYQDWVKTAPSLPQAFRHLEGVNLRDRVQCTTEIFLHMRYSKAAVDYYLCHLVFAKESKEFPHKLSASGWDLGKKKDNPTTGFSGTNDSRYVLPFDMKQLDLPEQKHTNALVLEYLLQPENGISLMPQEAKGTTFDSSLLLQMVSNMSPNTRVILDVGAQVVDLTNQEFAKRWLACFQDQDSTQAAVFFNDSDESVVMDRSGKIKDFQTSPFSQQLDLCLVFLDEAHTRGTDLKLPAEYRAVVTLGAGLTKDRLVQACMRMRKLGKGQTVEFCIPWEIEHKIVQLKGESTPNRSISVSDVLCWAITETCLDLKRAMPLWITQGVRFFKQEALWSRLSDENIKPDEFLEEEGQSLRERYFPQKGLADLSSLTEGLNDSVAKVFKSRCEEFGLERLRTYSLQEEQERELAPETQHERQVEKVPALKPDTHSVNRLLQEWIADGSFPESSTAFRAVMKPAFQSLNKTSAAVHFDVKEFPETVWVSMDFAHTVKGAFGGKNFLDSYQRPVQWVLVGKNEEGAPRIVVINPFEAQHFLPLIEESEYVALHLYAPRVNLAFRPVDDLQLCSVGKKVVEEIPRDIITFLNLFAGQLYLSSYDDYKLVCDMLCLAWDRLDDDAAGGSGSQCGFTKSPAMFLKEVLEKVRQDCGTIDKTDMGRVIEGVRLGEGDFENRHAI